MNIGLILLTILIVAIIYLLIESSNKKTLELIEFVKDKAKSHQDTLARKRKIYIQVGDYNQIIDNQWRKEVDSFLSLITSGRFDESKVNIHYHQLFKIVDDVAKGVDYSKFGKIKDNINNMDGVGYEDFCADRFREFGWEVKKTSVTGDQGVDLIVKKNNIKVAIQCKRYSGSVGNSAVQEVSAGKNYWDCKYGAVVTNSSYTQSAKNLANKLSITLIHHDQINDFYKKLISSD